MDSKKNVQTLQFLIDNYNGNIKTIINQEGDVDRLDWAYMFNKSPIKMRLFHCCVNMVEKPMIMIKMEIL